MRDVNRIDRILNQIKAYWHTYPDMRLAQIISNINSKARERQDLPEDLDVFFLEDDQLEQTLRELLRAGNDS